MNGQAIPTSGTICRTHHVLARWLRSFNIVVALSGMAVLLPACTEPTLPVRVVVPERMKFAVAPAEVDKLVLISLLKQRQFKALEAWFTTHQLAFETNQTSDDVLRYAFEAFAHSHPEMEARLDEWVGKANNPATALLARGIYYQHRALMTRNLLAITPREHLDEMEQHQTLAVRDGTRALALSPRLSIAYYHLDRANRELWPSRTKPTSEKRQWIAKGLESVPNSKVLRRAHLENLVRSSDISMDKIKTFVEATAKGLPQGGDLGDLPDFRAYAMSTALQRAGRYKDAAQLLDRAMASTDDAALRAEKAKLLLILDRNEEALKELTRALELEPQSFEYLNLHAVYRHIAGLLEGSLADYDTMLELDPYNPRILRDRGTVLSGMERHEEALADLDRSLVYGDFDPFIWFVRGRVMLYGRGVEEAIKEFDQGIKRDPRILRHLFKYASSLAERSEPASDLRECRRATMLRVYQQLCEKHGHCDPATLTSAEEMVAEIQTADETCG